MTKVTIKDVAREAGVSISTVSNALNGVDVLKPETRETILEVAERLHYMPDLNGRNLKAKETRVIGLFLPSMRGPYYGILCDSVFVECEKQNYELNVYISHHSRGMMNNLLGKRMDGAVIINEHISAANVEEIQRTEVPVIFLDREIQNKQIGSVLFDSCQAGMLAAEYLLKKGYKRLGYIAGAVRTYDDEKRFEGFKMGIERAGLRLEEPYIWQGGFEKELSYENVKTFLKRGIPLPQAIFASNDLSAIGCIEALQECGIRIPGDIAVMGCDDIELAAWYRPALTTIHTGFERQGELAVKKLTELIHQKESGNICKITGRIVERESVC